MAKLYFYYSAMNAGKSTTLLQSAHNYQEQGMRTLLFTPRLDDRYEVGQITSRIGLKQEALGFDNDDDLYLRIRKDHRQQKLSCILVDEAQFLTPKQVLQLTLVVDKVDLLKPPVGFHLHLDLDSERPVTLAEPDARDLHVVFVPKGKARRKPRDPKIPHLHQRLPHVLIQFQICFAVRGAPRETERGPPLLLVHS